MISVNTSLRRIFAAHGVKLSNQSDWLTTNGSYPMCRGLAADPRKDETGFGTQLDIELALNPHRTIIESFGDVGATSHEAVRNSLLNFSLGTLHVMLSAFWNDHYDMQVCREEWTLESGRWQLYFGNFVRKATRGHEAPVPDQLSSAIDTAIRNHTLTRSVHWARVYYAHINKDKRVTEVLLNNDPWDEGASAVAAVDWPALDFWYSCRTFLVLRPVD